MSSAVGLYEPWEPQWTESETTKIDQRFKHLLPHSAHPKPNRTHRRPSSARSEKSQAWLSNSRHAKARAMSAQPNRAAVGVTNRRKISEKVRGQQYGWGWNLITQEELKFTSHPYSQPRKSVQHHINTEIQQQQPYLRSTQPLLNAQPPAQNPAPKLHHPSSAIAYSDEAIPGLDEKEEDSTFLTTVSPLRSPRHNPTQTTLLQAYSSQLALTKDSKKTSNPSLDYPFPVRDSFSPSHRTHRSNPDVKPQLTKQRTKQILPGDDERVEQI